MHACMMIVFKQKYNNLISCNVTLFNMFIKQCNKYLTFIKIALCLIVNADRGSIFRKKQEIGLAAFPLLCLRIGAGNLAYEHR